MINWKLWLGVGAVVLGLGWLVLHYAGESASNDLRADIAENTVSVAVEQRKQELKADAQVQAENRVTLDSAKRKALPARKYLETKTVHSGDCAVADPEWGRVFDAALTGSREAISTARSMPQ